MLLSAVTVISSVMMSTAADDETNRLIYGEYDTADTNDDGKITLSDVTLILKHIAKWDVEFNKSAADVNGDGRINLSDATTALKHIAKWDVEMKDSFRYVDYGVREVDFEIPDPETDKTVSGAEFGFDPEAADNSRAFRAAVAYLKENPGTHLIIEKNTYRMSAGTSISGLKNCIIDWNGSTLVLDTPTTYFSIIGCENLKFCNMTTKWDWEKDRLGSLVRIKSNTPIDSGTRKIEMELLYEEDAPYVMSQRWDSMMQLDPETMTSAYGTLYQPDENFIDRTIDGNVITMTSIGLNPAVGSIYLIRHHNYDGLVFNIVGESSGIVLDNNTLYGNSGCGFGISGGSHHVRISRLFIGLDPDNADRNRISTTADAIHIKDTKGYFILEDSDIGYNGDDCLNIHDNVGIVMDTAGDTLYMHTANTSGFNAGHTLGFKNGDTYEEIDFEAKILKASRAANGWYVLTLDRDCSELEYKNVVYDKDLNSAHYIIRNNYFHENRARGLLLGSSDGLVENNRFYHIEQAAMNIPIDITKDMWDEGTGVDNLIIRNNTIERCQPSDPNGAAILFVVNNSFNDSGMIQGNCFKNVMIANNRFIDPHGHAIIASSVYNLTVFGNTFGYTQNVIGDRIPKTNGKIKLSGLYYDNSHIIGNTWHINELAPEDVNEVTYYKTNQSKITIKYNNTVK